MKCRTWPLWILSGATVLTALSAQPPANADKAYAKVVNTGTTPKPIAWPSPALPDEPIALETAVERNLRMVVAKGLVQPWSMAFLPDGGILITERPGRLRLVRNGVLQAAPIAGLPPIYAQGLGGLMDIALHPRLAENAHTHARPRTLDRNGHRRV
jgi:glucose/arabinose dehydrogenase